MIRVRKTRSQNAFAIGGCLVRKYASFVATFTEYEVTTKHARKKSELELTKVLSLIHIVVDDRLFGYDSEYRYSIQGKIVLITSTPGR